MNWKSWRAHFEANALRPLPPVAVPALSAERRAALAKSLARFQLGEAGEGRIAHQIDSVSLPTVDDDYRVSLKLFVKEEGRHARILGQMVNGLGGRLLTKSWTDKLFVLARRMVGIRFKLLVLLAAEVIGIGFYGVLSEVLPEGEVARALKQLCDDEEHHLRFHCDFFRAQRVTPVAYWLLRLAWWPLGLCAALAVLLDHRHTLRAFDASVWVTAKSLWARVAESGRRIAATAPSARAVAAGA